MDIFSLNYDVFTAISYYLGGQDALNFSLTSKQAREVSFPFLAEEARCLHPGKLEVLRDAMISSEGSRFSYSQFLKKLIVDFGDHAPQIPRTSAFHLEKGDPSSKHVPNLSHVLSRSQNLQFLRINIMESTFTNDDISLTRIGEALLRLEHLAEAQIISLDSPDHLLLRFLPSGLVRLAIWFIPRVIDGEADDSY